MSGAPALSVPSRSRQLARFAAGLAYESLPSEVVHAARRALVDWMAAALAGAAEPSALKVQRVAAAQDAAGPVRVVGTRLSTNVSFAALCGAYASHLLDYDDVYNPPETTIHLGSCLWPVVMAAGQLRGLSGRAAVAAYVAGFETGARAARAAGPKHYESAWHVTGTTGHLASVAAAANAFGLTAGEATHAFGTAATQGSGLREIYGSDTKAIHPAKAAMDGVLSALLAEAGFTSTDTALEGPRGLLRAVSPEPDPDWLTRGLGSEWMVLENGHKLYPTASLTHAAIEAATRLSPRLNVDRVERIEVRMHPFPAAVTAALQPATGAEARFSTPHCVVAALLHGGLPMSDFRDEVVADTRLAALRARVAIVPDETINKRGSRLTLTLPGGETVVDEVAGNRGTPDAPLTDEDLAGKLDRMARPVLGERAARELAERCWRIEEVADLGELVGLSVPAAPLADAV